MASGRPHGPSRPSFFLLYLLLGCGDGVRARELDSTQRDLLAHGSWRRAARAGAPVRAGPLRLMAGERWVLELALSGPARLELGLSGAPGRLDLELGSFEPLAGEALEPAPLQSLEIPGGSSQQALVELPDPGGKVLCLALEWTPDEPGGEGLLEHALLSEPGRVRPPSIVFLSVDTFSASHMSLYGYERKTTPHIDSLASGAVTFDEAFANATWTTTSYVSQLSGLLPGASRVDPAAWQWVVPEGRWTLAEVLRARGYRTAAFVDNLNADAGYGLAQGFEVYDMSSAHMPKEEARSGIERVASLAQDWLDELDPEEPFFLFLQVLDLHAPYLPPPEFAGRSAAEGGPPASPARLPVEALQPEGYHPVILGAAPRMVAVSFAEQIKQGGWIDTASVIDAYDDQIRSLDASIGAFLEELRARGLYEDCVVLVSADHGETMLEHETYFRHVNNYRENLRVPLVLRLPGGRAAGKRVADTVQLVDLYPTLAELAGLSPSAHALHGRSLMPLVEGSRPAPVPVLSQTGIGNADSIISAGWKLIALDPAWMSVNQRLSLPQTRRWLAEHHPGFEDVVFGTIDWDEAAARPGAAAAMAGAKAFVDGMGIFYELYDLERDPGELRDLAAEEPERLAELLALLERERARAAAARAAVPHDPGQAGVERTTEQLEELRKLGYTGDDG